MEGWRQTRERWLLLAPALIILAAITVSPLLQTVWLSFTDREITSIAQPVHFIGLENYAYTLTDPDFAAGAEADAVLHIRLGRPRDCVAESSSLFSSISNFTAATSCER